MRHGSLFSGIGGFDYAASIMGWDNVFHCEINEFCQKILKYYWPETISYADIKKTDFTIFRGRIDVLTGGFPCQPYSMAGKRLGKEDDRHLWPEMLRAIREIQPGYILGENVRGITNWNGGMVFDEVQADLEAEGYEVLPFLLPACGVNAPHRRERIWFMAYPHNARDSTSRSGLNSNRKKEDEGGQQPFTELNRHSITPHSESNRNRGGLYGVEGADGGQRQPQEHRQDDNQSRNDGQKRDVTDTKTIGQEPSGETRERRTGLADGNIRTSEWILPYTDAARKRWNKWQSESKSNLWENFPTQSPICSGDDELPRKLDGITFSKWRNESIKGYGNAVVPQLVMQFFKVIEYMSKNEILG